MATYNRTLKKGDTWKGAQITIAVNGAPLNLTGASINLDFLGARSSVAALTLSVGSGIVITNAALGILTISERIMNLEAGLYKIELQVVIGATKKTYVEGLFTITKEIPGV